MKKAASFFCLLAAVCGVSYFPPIVTAATRTSCSRTIRNVAFNANSTLMTFDSPSYPNTYPLSLNCTYLFTAPEGHRIELAFSSFQMEGASPRCTNDYIEVREGPNGKSSLIDKFCGSLEPKPVISSANSVYLFFVSNDKFQFQGFRGTYRIVSEVEIAECTKMMNSAILFSRGHFTSPTYPAKYPPTRQCSWTLQAPPEYFMTLIFHTFQTQCPNDKVIIRDHDASGQLLGEFCGEEKPSVFRGRKLWVGFNSDASFAVNEKGFNATYETLPFKGHISEHCTEGSGEIINVNASTPGTIRSPWMPDFYPNNIICIWRIRAPKGERVKLTFSSFNLESPCDTDYVEVSDVPVQSTNSKSKFCLDYPDTVSAAEEVTVRFVTGSRGRRKGFVMQYAVNKGSRADLSVGGLISFLYAMLLLTDYCRIR